MTIRELIKELEKYDPDFTVAIKEKTKSNDDGFIHSSWEWVAMEKKFINKPAIGNTVYLGIL